MVFHLSDKEMPRIGLGCMGLGGRYERDDQNDSNATLIIQFAYELGINFFDTAEVYGAGYGETLLGKSVSAFRHDIAIATKFSAHNASFNGLKKACEDSLARLGTDYIDLYQCHWPNPDIPFEETIKGLEVLHQEGKIRHVGFSNVTSTQLSQIASLLPSGLELVSAQQDYSLQQRFIEHRILPYCQQQNIQTIAYSPLGQGSLIFKDEQQAVLGDLAQKYTCSIPALMLAWVISHDQVLAIPMTSNIDHLKSNLTALNVKIAGDDLERLSKAFTQQVEEINTDAIEVLTSHTGKAFRNLEEALANIHELSPSPSKLAEELVDGEMLKPVKVRPKKGHAGRYELFEGQLRYWGWVIAHKGQKPITALVEDKVL